MATAAAAINQQQYTMRSAPPPCRAATCPGASFAPVGVDDRSCCSFAQRSFSSGVVEPHSPGLRGPFGYANTLAALFVFGVPTALVLGTRRRARRARVRRGPGLHV